MTMTPFAAAMPPAAAVPDGVTMLRAWAGAASEAAQLVAPLVDTPFVPDAFRPKVDPRASAEEKAAAREVAVASATAAVLYGAGLGLDPMTSLQNIYVVGGRPGLYAAAMVALAQAHGHDVQTVDLTDHRAVVRARRRGTEHWETVTFTLDQAKKAGYTRNAKYAQDPQAMLWARAASIAIRRIAQDTLKGIAAVEELQDDEVRGSTAGTRTVQRAAAPRALDTAQVLADSPPPVPGDLTIDEKVRGALSGAEPDTAPIDESAWRRINARFVDLGVTGPGQTAQRLAVIGDVVGREVKRGGELTAAEAQLVLDNLAGETGARLVRRLLDPVDGAQLERNIAAAAGPDPSPARAALADLEREAAGLPAGPALPGEREDPPADPWGINDDSAEDAGDEQALDVPGDER
jgi:hypothetical protein